MIAVRRDRGWRVLIIDAAGRRTYLGPTYQSQRVAEAVRDAWLVRNGARPGEQSYVVRDLGVTPDDVQVLE